MYYFGKRNVLRFDLKESKEKGYSFHEEESKTERVPEPTVECLVRGIWRLRLSEAGISLTEIVYFTD